MSQGNRLAQGGRLDRGTTVGFSFNGKSYQGYAGDTVASALLANGVHMVARSWKYHRPRGIVGHGAEEPNALLQLETGKYTVPNARATQVELYDGLTATSVNCWPSLDFDLLSATGLVSKMLPAGFYYKTFMWPQNMWLKYEHWIRKSAGLGSAPLDPDPDLYEKTYAHCDVLVAGAGPAGLAAALAAGRTGARVIIADEQSEFGGGLLADPQPIDGKPAAEWVAGAVRELAGMAEVRVLPRSTVYGYLDHNLLVIDERLTDHLPLKRRQGFRNRIWRVRAKQVVLATGAHERPLAFGNNDVPGIMLASSVSAYVNRYAVAPGTKALVFTNNDSAYQCALDLRQAGIAVAAVVDCRANPQGTLPARARDQGVEVIAGSVIVGVKGSKRVQGVEVMALDANGRSVQGEARAIDCDLVAVSGGWSPIVHLSAQSGAKAAWDDAKACFLPGKPVQAERSAGACKGTFGRSGCLQEGLSAGAEAAKLCGFGDGSAPSAPESAETPEEPIQPLWLVPSREQPGHGPKAFLDLQNDVGASDVMLAAREGYQSIEHVKRYTALGFGTDQGKLGNINGMAILADVLKQPIASVGTTTFRPNYTPVSFGALAGRDLGDLLDPIRKTAMHQWHEENGAEFENVGQWKRAWYFPKPGESIHDAVNRECLATRNSVGVMDASTLGKIEAHGPDAGEFLNRIYTNAWKKLGIGQCRYGLMLKEDGMIFDDGVGAKLAENHYYLTTTTGGAAGVLAWMERWLQTEWPDLKVHFTSVTDHWATMAVVGPNSRAVVSSLCNDIDFSAEAFPFMTWREGTVAGVPARVFRISFSGELAYEVNVSANFGRHLWEAVMEAGKPHNITPYGTETMHVLRAEKGYIIVGQDTDGSISPIDAGMSWAVAKNKDFIGRRSLSRSDTVRTDRKQLVGLLTEDPKEVLPEGGQIVDNPDAPVPVPMIGHVTSSYYSACLERSIAMAVVKGGHSRMGDTVKIPLVDGRVIPAKIASPVFYDPEGARQNV